MCVCVCVCVGGGGGSSQKVGNFWGKVKKKVIAVNVVPGFCLFNENQPFQTTRF